MSNTNFVGQIGGVVESANGQGFTLTSEQLIEFMKKVINAVLDAVSMVGDETVITGMQALGALKQIYLDMDGKLRKKYDFKSDREAMITIYDTAYALLTVDDFRSEAARIIDNIMKDEAFAHEFLYGTSRQNGKSIARLRSRILYEILISYKVEVNPKDFNTILYEHLYSEGTWRTLRSYGYRTTFFQWIRTVASHCIMDYLEKNNFITISRARTAGNTRLELMDKTPLYCECLINDIVKVASVRDILLAVYVDRLEPEAVQERLKIKATDYNLTLSSAENSLKTLLINTVHPYDDALVDINVRKTTVSTDFLTLIGSFTAVNGESGPLREVLGIDPESPEFEITVTDFLYEFSNRLGWSKEDIYVWQSRYIKTMAPESIALDLDGRDRRWVDTRFHRLNKRFETAIRKWWDKVAC